MRTWLIFNNFYATITTIMFICVLHLSQQSSYNNGKERKVCKSIEIKNNLTLLKEFSDCNVIDGRVRIMLMDLLSESAFQNIALNNLYEITQYLVIYRVANLTSLNLLFPKLSLIRGTTLFHNNALVIFDNQRLHTVGLDRLTHIVRGSVSIANNPNLCYVNSIDWDRIISKTNKTYYDVKIANNKEEYSCESHKNCKRIAKCDNCWSESSCQLTKLEGCHPLCAGGCFRNDSARHCFACTGLMLNETNECVASCPSGTYELWKRLCVNESTCKGINVTLKNGVKSYPYFTFNGSCISKCPNKYQLTDNGKGCVSCDDVECYKKCPEGESRSSYMYTIDTVASSEQLQSCTHINGSLQIKIKFGNYSELLEAELEENLGMIKQIDGQLKVMHSHSIESLNFLKSLEKIGKNWSGSSSNYNESLIVKDNKNLKQLWDWKKKKSGSKFDIEPKGILFHDNPKLCLSEIDNFVRIAKLDNYTEYQVSKLSNGNGVRCNWKSLKVTVDQIESTSVILLIHVWSENDIEKLNKKCEKYDRYIVYYGEKKYVQINDENLERNPFFQCGDNRWKMLDTAIQYYGKGSVSTILTHLQPDTEYVFFVTTYMSSPDMAASSPVLHVTTLPSKPSAPYFIANETTDSEIYLKWSPPYHPYGKLLNYRLRGYSQKITHPINRDYCKYKIIWKNDQKSIIKSTTSTTVAPTSPLNECKCDNSTNEEKVEEKSCNNMYEKNSEFNYQSLEDKSIIEPCDNLIYSFIETNYKLLYPSEHNSFPGEINGTQTQPEEAEWTNVTGKDGKYDKFSIQVPANETWTLIGNLRHFTEYTIFITACREAIENEKSDLCSRETITTIRTAASTKADIILKDSIKINTNYESANISWESPLIENGFIHSYEIEYKNKDFINSKYAEQCITRSVFENHNKTFQINNIPSGNYVIRLKAVSLSGEGPYTQVEFLIQELRQNQNTILITTIILISVILVIIITLLYYWKTQIIKEKVLFASVNPRYEPVYLEDHWEVPRENLILIRQLGRGSFGSVHEGLLKPNDVKVAVKTTMNVSDEDNYTFLKEATIMKEFDKTYHIVKLLGIISKGTPVYVIMELMENGDLKSYLIRAASDICHNSRTLPEDIILKMAAEIADGMAYLEAKKFVHRDLAARNCMVNGNGEIKIGDFGLARDIYSTDYYRKGDKGTLPIRWMAPESIRDGIFTSQSDAWSYGVVLWEITTLAQLPYHPMANEEVIRYIHQGQTLDIPSNTHTVLRPVIKCCWKWYPSQRPRFVQILKHLDPYLKDNFRKVSYFHNGESPDDPTNVVPAQLTYNDIYPPPDEFDEANLQLLDHSTTSSSPSSVKFRWTVPFLNHVNSQT